MLLTLKFGILKFSYGDILFVLQNGDFVFVLFCFVCFCVLFCVVLFCFGGHNESNVLFCFVFVFVFRGVILNQNVYNNMSNTIILSGATKHNKDVHNLCHDSFK